MQTLRTAATQPSFTPNNPITLAHTFHVHHELIRLIACTSRTVTYNTSPSSSQANTHTSRTTESATDQKRATLQGVKSGYHRIHAAISNNQMKEPITMQHHSHGIEDTECILQHNKPITWIPQESKRGIKQRQSAHPNHWAHEMDSIRNNRKRIDKTDRQWKQSRLVQLRSTQIHALNPYSNSFSNNSSTFKIIKSNNKSNQFTPLVPPFQDGKQSKQLTHHQRTLVYVRLGGGSTSEESGQLPP